MDAITLKRAYIALQNEKKLTSKKTLPLLYVVEDTIYFTLHAAYLHAKERLILDGKHYKIETVTAQEVLHIHSFEELRRANVDVDFNTVGCITPAERIEMRAWLKRHKSIYNSRY